MCVHANAHSISIVQCVLLSLHTPENLHRVKTLSDWLANMASIPPIIYFSHSLSRLFLLPFLKFSFLLNVCHLCHLSMVLRSPIPSFALHAILSFSCFTLLEN